MGWVTTTSTQSTPRTVYSTSVQTRTETREGARTVEGPGGSTQQVRYTYTIEVTFEVVEERVVIEQVTITDVTFVEDSGPAGLDNDALAEDVLNDVRANVAAETPASLTEVDDIVRGAVDGQLAVRGYVAPTASFDVYAGESCPQCTGIAVVDENLLLEEDAVVNEDGLANADTLGEVDATDGRPGVTDDRLELEDAYAAAIANGQIPPFLRVNDPTSARTDQLQRAVAHANLPPATGGQVNGFGYVSDNGAGFLTLPSYGAWQPMPEPGQPPPILFTATFDGTRGPIALLDTDYGPSFQLRDPNDPLAGFSWRAPVGLGGATSDVEVNDPPALIRPDPYSNNIEYSVAGPLGTHTTVFDSVTGEPTTDTYPLPGTDALDLPAGTRVRIDYGTDGQVTDVQLLSATGEPVPASILYDENGTITYLRNAANNEVIRPDAAMSPVEMQMYGQLGEDGAQAILQAAQNAGFDPNREEELSAFLSSSDGARMYLNLADTQAETVSVEQVASAGIDPNSPEGQLSVEQLAAAHVDTALATAMDTAVDSDRLVEIEAEAIAAVESTMGLSPGSRGYDSAVDGVRQGILLAEYGPILDAYAEFYAQATQEDYETHIAAGGTPESFVARRVQTEGISPTGKPLALDIVRNVVLANDPTLNAMDPAAVSTGLNYDWALHEAVQAGLNPPADYTPPTADQLAVYEAMQAVHTTVNQGVIDGWRAQHNAMIAQYEAMIDSVDEESGFIDEALVFAYENANLLNASGLPILLGPEVTLEDIFGEATSEAEARAALAALDAAMVGENGFLSRLNPGAMGPADLAVAEYERAQVVAQHDNIGGVIDAYAQTMGYASIGSEVVKTVGVVAATLATASGVGAPAGAVILASITAGTATRVGIDLLDAGLSGDTYDVDDLTHSLQRGVVDSSLSLISYMAAGHAFRAAQTASRGVGLTARQSLWVGRTAGFGAETLVDAGANVGMGLAEGRSNDEIAFDIALGIGLNLGFSTVGGFDYDTRVVGRQEITEGPNAGMWALTLADGNTRTVPPWTMPYLSVAEPSNIIQSRQQFMADPSIAAALDTFQQRWPASYERVMSTAPRLLAENPDLTPAEAFVIADSIGNPDYQLFAIVDGELNPLGVHHSVTASTLSDLSNAQSLEFVHFHDRGDIQPSGVDRYFAQVANALFPDSNVTHRLVSIDTRGAPVLGESFGPDEFTPEAPDTISPDFVMPVAARSGSSQPVWESNDGPFRVEIYGPLSERRGDLLVTDLNQALQDDRTFVGVVYRNENDELTLALYPTPQGPANGYHGDVHWILNGERDLDEFEYDFVGAVSVTLGPDGFEVTGQSSLNAGRRGDFNSNDEGMREADSIAIDAAQVALNPFMPEDLQVTPDDLTAVESIVSYTDSLLSPKSADDTALTPDDDIPVWDDEDDPAFQAIVDELGDPEAFADSAMSGDDDFFDDEDLFGNDEFEPR